MVRPPWYDTPIVWFAIQVADLLLLAFAFSVLVPDTWPAPIVIAIAIGGFAAIWFANYRLLRWLRRRNEIAEAVRDRRGRSSDPMIPPS
jgi:hypothetical protein